MTSFDDFSDKPGQFVGCQVKMSFIEDKEDEDLTFMDVLKVADRAIHWLKELKDINWNTGGLDINWCPVLTKNRIEKLGLVERLIHKKIDQLVTDCKEVKKFVMRSLRGKLSELLPVLSLEEDILDNIFGYMNPQDEDANVTWKFVEITEEEKAILISLYRHLREVYRQTRDSLLAHPFSILPYFAVPRYLLGDQLQKILAEINDREDCIGVGELEDQGGQD